MARVVAGEGTYGCVHKPSIPCKTPPNPGFSYNNYVSKIMTDKHARKELEEFLIIGQYDKSNEYHLGEPILCTPKMDSETINDINKCNNIKIKPNNLDKDNEKYKLLILKDGGPDLKIFCKNHITEYLSTNKEVKSDKFWLEVHHLLKGLKFLRKNGLVHNDIKPQNILFDMSKNKLMFIDFGLMNTRSNIIENSYDNENYLGIFHWSYPLECGFMNKEWFDEYKNPRTEKIIQNEIHDLFLKIRQKSSLPTLKYPASFDILFSYIDEKNVVPKPSIIRSYLTDFYLGMSIYKYQDDYEMFLMDTTDSIDIYGLGFTLKYILNCFKRHNAISDAFYFKATELFKSMYDFNLRTRQLNIDILLDNYKNILEETGILRRLNKKITVLSIRSKSFSKSHVSTNVDIDVDNMSNLNPVELGTIYKPSDNKKPKTPSRIPIFSNTSNVIKKTNKRRRRRNRTKNRKRAPPNVNPFSS